MQRGRQARKAEKIAKPLNGGGERKARVARYKTGRGGGKNRKEEQRATAKPQSIFTDSESKKRDGKRGSGGTGL